MAKKNTAPKTSTAEDTDWMKSDPVTVEKVGGKADKKAKPGAKAEKAPKPGAKAEKAPKAVDDAEKVAKTGRPSRVGNKKLRVNEANLGERDTLMKRIALAFGKGKTSAEVVEALSGNLEVPRSKVYESNPRGFIQGYITAAVNAKALVEV